MAPSLAFVVPYRFLPPQNGGQHAAAGFARALAQQCDLHLITTPDNVGQDKDLVCHPLLGRGIGRYLSPLRAWRIRNFLRKQNIKKVILFQPFPGLLFLPLVWLGEIELAVYEQNLEYQRFRSLDKWWWPLMYLFEGLILRHCSAIYFISPDEVQPGIEAFGLQADRCKVVPYSTNLQDAPDAKSIRAQIRSQHNFNQQARLLLFFGPQSYAPNLDAVRFVVEEVMPQLRTSALEEVHFLICGGGLPKELQASPAFQQKDVHYLGFVPKIEPYVQAADLVLNPIDTGGGVKTKVIESIALGIPVLSFQSGALGVHQEVCGPQLKIVADQDASAFTAAIIEILAQPKTQTPEAFYQHYYWPRAVQVVIKSDGFPKSVGFK